MAICNANVTYENISNKLNVLIVDELSTKDVTSLAKTRVRKIVSVSDGNMKLGKLVSISTLPGSDDWLVPGIPGTCHEYGKICEHSGCYACKSCKLYPSVRWAYAKNTLLKRTNPKLFWDLLARYIGLVKPSEVRINTSGEFEDINDILEWNKMAKSFPYTKFYSYTKNYEAVINFKNKGYKYYHNFIIHLSGWKNDKKVQEVSNYTGLPIFYYVDHNDPQEVEKYKQMGLPFCPGIDKNGNHTGVTCDNCPLCKGNYTCACFSH